MEKLPKTAGVGQYLIKGHLFKTPSAGFGINKQEKGTSPQQIAKLFLVNGAKKFQLSTPDRCVRLREVVQSALGSHVFFQQMHRRRRVSNAWLRVDIDEAGVVTSFHNRLFPNSALNRADRYSSATSRISANEAFENIRQVNDFGEHRSPELCEDSKLRYRLVGKTPRLAWKLKVVLENPRDCMNVYVDAHNGELLNSESYLFHSTIGSGKVFCPNPIVALNDPNLSDSDVLPNEAYRNVPLPNLTGSGLLDGKYVTTVASPSPRASRSDHRFEYARKSSRFLEVMAYYHIDKAQQYVQSLRYRRAHPHAVRVNIKGRTDEVSEYDPSRDTISLATGGIPDGEDAEIILHEYAHAIHSSINRPFGRDNISINMAEGFADYFAASFFEEEKSNRFRGRIASWDARGQGDDRAVPFLRKLTSNRKLQDLLDEQDNLPRGRHTPVVEFWSSVLWQIRKLLGRHRADNIIIGSLYFLPQPFSFFNAGLAILEANRRGYGQSMRTELIELMRRRGIFQ